MNPTTDAPKETPPSTSTTLLYRLPRLGQMWRTFKQGYQAARPCRLTAATVVAVPVIFVFVPQATEVLRCLAEGPAQAEGYSWHFAWLVAALLGSLATLSLYTWFSTRVLLNFKFPDSPKITAPVKTVMLLLPRILALIPPFGMALAFFIASTVYDGASRGFAYVLWGLGAACGGVAVLLHLFFLKRRSFLEARHRSVVPVAAELSHVMDLPKSTKIWLIALASLSALLLFLFIFWPVTGAQWVGAAPVIFFAAASWVGYGNVIIYASHRFQLPLIGSLVVLAAMFSCSNDNHHIRTLRAAKPDRRPELRTHYETWYSNLTNRFPNRGSYPVIIVAAEGGGIRAAFWTATVLAHLQDRNTNFGAHVFAISGVSGGSLGATIFNALLAQPVAPSNYQHAVSNILSRDFLSPTLACMVGPDLVQRFLPMPIAYFDRGKVLEEGWEDAWASVMGNQQLRAGFHSLWSDPDRLMPALFLNGTSVETGKRIVTSNVRVTAGFADCIDAFDKLPSEIRLSTAAHMSARFTYVSPAGRFCDGEHVVDGGYFENSGAATASEILEVMNIASAPGAERVVILISNNPERGRTAEATDLLSEVFAPIQALLRTREARGSYAEATLDLLHNYESISFTLTNRGTPLPLGWALSQRAVHEMQSQLTNQTSSIELSLEKLPK